MAGVVDPEEVSDEDVPLLLPPLRPVHEVVEVSAGRVRPDLSGIHATSHREMCTLELYLMDVFKYIQYIINRLVNGFQWTSMH